MNASPIIVYTDGSCLKNPGGPGGWAALLMFKGVEKELAGGFRCTTNNRMELMGVLKALEFLSLLNRPCLIHIFSDSRYVVDAVNKGRLKSWANGGWLLKSSKNTKNTDLWKLIYDLLQYHSVEFHWVPAHRGVVENERVDRLAKEQAYKCRCTLPSDVGYYNPVGASS